MAVSVGKLVIRFGVAPATQNRRSADKDKSDNPACSNPGREHVPFCNESTETSDDDDSDDHDSDDDHDHDNSNENTAPQAITAAVLKVDHIEITGTDGGKMSLDVSGEVDLLKVLAGEPQLLGEVVLPANTHIGQLRLILAEGSYVTADGEQYPLKVPSGEQTGLKIHGDWGISGGQITELQLDFSAEDIRFNKAQGYSIRPTVKVAGVVTAALPVDEDGGIELPGANNPFVIKIGGDSDAYGLTLTVPPGAHPNPSSLSVKVAVDTMTRLTPVYKFEPDGTEFLEPVTVTLKYNPRVLGGFSDGDPGFMPSDISFLHNGSGIETVVNAENHTLTAKITHFSDGQGGITQGCPDEDKLTNAIFADVVLSDFYANSARKLCRMGILHGKVKDGKRIVDPGTKTNVIEVLKIILSAKDSKTRYSGEDWPKTMGEIRSDAETNLPGETIPPSGEAIERGVVIKWISKLFFTGASESEAINKMIEEGITNGKRMFAKDVTQSDPQYDGCYNRLYRKIYIYVCINIFYIKIHDFTFSNKN